MSVVFSPPKWMPVKMFSEYSGYTVKAINNKIDNGIWKQGSLWKKAPDNRRIINTLEYEKWQESQ